METAIANLYHTIFEGTNRFLFPASTNDLPSHSHDDRISALKIGYFQRLPEILQKILLFWRDTSSNKSWALEKFCEVICADQAKNLVILLKEDLVNFIYGFFDENEKLLLYPDFVMNEVSKILTAVLLSRTEVSDNLKQTTFNIIRSPFDYGLIDKGHRLHTVFQCLQRLLPTLVGQGLMQKHNFDVSFALGISLVSGHNYTRKSAKDYLVALVRYAFESTFVSGNAQTSQENANVKVETKAQIKDSILTNMSAFIENLMRCPDVQYDCHIVARYCEILCSCAVESDDWCKSLDELVKHEHHDLFNFLLNLLIDLHVRKYSDDHQLTARVIQTLIKLLSMQDGAKENEENVDKLFKFIAKYLYLQPTRINLNELMQISHTLYFQCDCSSTASRTLLEFSLLPLHCILGVPLSCREHFQPELLKRCRQKLQVESLGKFPVVIDLSVRTAFELDIQKIHPDLVPLVKYVTMKSQECPSIVSQPFLNNKEIRNSECLACMLSCFRHITPILCNNAKEIAPEMIACIEQCMEAVFNTTFTSYEHLHTAFSCFLTLLRQRPKTKDSNTYPSRHVLSSVISSLQLHMVSVNLATREEAVKCVRELYLSDDTSVTEELREAKAILSLWHCVKDKAEGVVFEVLDFILHAAKRRTLSTLLSYMNLTQEDLITETRNIVLSNPWDSVKSTAFHILSTMCKTSDTVRYAEALLAVENPNLTSAVLKFMQELFKRLTTDDKNFEPLCRVFVEGWGDLLLKNVNAQDVNAFRMAMDILVNLHNFITNSKVVEVFKKRLMVSLIESEQNLKQKNLSKTDDLYARKEEVLNYWEELSHCLRRLQERQETTESKLEKDLSGPPHKMIKMDDNTSFNSLADSERFICSITSFNKESILTIHKHCLHESKAVQYGTDCVIDSTKELPSLQLKTKPFPSQELLFALLGSEEADLNSVSSFLLTFMNFKEVLAKLDIHKLLNEAHRSTDQYAMNEDMVVEDLDNLLERTFSQSSRQLERNITGIFVSESLDLINSLLETIDGNKEGCLSSLEKFLSKLIHLRLSKRDVFKYIISKRKTVFLEKWTPEKCSFSLDTFIERFRQLQIQGTSVLNLKEHYQSIKDLKCLLDEYTGEKFLQQSSESESKSIEGSLKTERLSAETCPPTTIDSLMPEMMMAETTVLATNINCLKKMLESMIQENLKCPDKILLWLKSLCEVLKQCLEKVVDIGEEMQKLQPLVMQMNSWYNDEEEDEFDDDNDPTLIDCF